MSNISISVMRSVPREHGTPVHMAGEVQPLADAPHAALALTLNALDVAALQAYMPDTLPMRLYLIGAEVKQIVCTYRYDTAFINVYQ